MITFGFRPRCLIASYIQVAIFLLAVLTALPAIEPVAALENAAPPGHSADSSFSILDYIHRGWHTLERSTNECGSFIDPKLKNPGLVLYLPADVPRPLVLASIETTCGVEIKHLPRVIHHLGDVRPEELPAPGLLYLPNPYVVPGGRFNEMYGWDSYFIVRGLIEDGELDLARGMLENFFFEIEHYGGVLNANRTYYFTRSQPPLLSSAVEALHAANRSAKRDDSAWLARAYPYLVRDHALWVSAAKRDATTGLSHYYDLGSGPVPEIGDHSDYYVTVADWLLQHPSEGHGFLASNAAGRTGSALHASNGEVVWLTPEFYKGDRAMRESGFDITFRFAPFGGDAHKYAPTCLNSLLYIEEMDLAKIAGELHRASEARRWRTAAHIRRRQVKRYLWSAKQGLFVDYDLVRKKQSTYLYATAFYPLWAGLATPAQARAIVANTRLLEMEGGIATSDVETGVQWDKPYGWAPIELIAVEGLRRYGFAADADRITIKFLSTILVNARKEGTLREKYNVETRSTVASVTAGYSSNVIGFGWTNGVFLALLHELSPASQAALLRPEVAHNEP